MTALAESCALHARARAWMEAFERMDAPPESFDRLACDLARFQAAHVAGYARLFEACGRSPTQIARAAEAPAVPAEAFRVARVFAFDEQDATVAFRTSGTTLGARGTHRMRDVGTYDAAALAFGRRMIAADVSPPLPVLVLGPAPAEAGDSSLGHMCALFASALGEAAPPEETFFVTGGTLDVVRLRRRIAALTPRRPALLLATSFALVHLLEALAGEGLPLPPGSRVMQTGGYKGKARAVAPGELRTQIAASLDVPPRSVVAEYGMTELSSQFWEATLVDPAAPAGVYVEPPWARVVPVDPEALTPIADGEVGLARIEDLANVDSAFAVLAQDRVRRVAGGFELLGRHAGAPPRGCSIAVDEMLGGDARAR